MQNRNLAEKLFKKSVSIAVKLDPAFSSDPVNNHGETNPDNGSIRKLFSLITADSPDGLTEPLINTPHFKALKEAKEVFVRFYAQKGDYTERILGELSKETSWGKLSEIISKIWLPELSSDDEEIKRHWHLRDVKKNPDPLKPVDITIQLNSLYTLPERGPLPFFEQTALEWNKVKDNPGSKIADYDHPVPLFAEEADHELLKCLDELDGDIDYEKEMKVLPPEHKVPVTLSVSVTHQNINRVCGIWLREILKSRHYNNLKILLLTEEAVKSIKENLIGNDLSVFSVSGTYARHFNALKYTQLLLERGYGIQGGFKLDTDEGIHSRNLYRATGKTWLTTLCHPYWGGSAVNWKGESVTLSVNVGEYINSTDMETSGYKASMRFPDVKVPENYNGANIFFQKGFAHGRATALYNRYNNLEDFISHPVVKGGGYGIDNNGLKKGAPFTFSGVGRAEDQQFYFQGLSSGIAGIFHPDLRIIHYKNSVAKVEAKTLPTRFMGDMYRLLLFSTLCKILNIKEELDPMPGIFTGELAFSQAVLHTLYNAVIYRNNGEWKAGDHLLTEGFSELLTLWERIKGGEIGPALADEQEQWKTFVLRVSKIEKERVRKYLDPLFI